MLNLKKSLINNFRAVPAIAAALALMTLTGCGGDGGSKTPTPTPTPAVSIAISPTSQDVEAGTSTGVLTVSPVNTDILWPTLPAGGGTFIVDRHGAKFTPPPVEGTYTFTVTASADQTKKASATIKVYYVDPVPNPPSLSGTAEPGSEPTEHINNKDTVQLKTSFYIPYGTELDQMPVWETSDSVSTAASASDAVSIYAACGTISNQSYTIDTDTRKITATADFKSTITSGNCYVRAAVFGGKNQLIYSNPLTITVYDGQFIDVTPKTTASTPSLFDGQTRQYTATVALPTGQAAQTPTWSVIGNCGVVNPVNGTTTTFIAAAAGTCSVRATIPGVNNNPTYDEVAVTVVNNAGDPTITVTPAHSDAFIGNTRSFNAAVNTPAGQTPQTPTWSVVGNCGTVSPTTGGSTTFTASSAGTCTVRASVNTVNGNPVYGTATVTVTTDERQPTISISPSAQWNPEKGETRTFTATANFPQGQATNPVIWEKTGDCVSAPSAAQGNTAAFTAEKFGRCQLSASVLNEQNQKVSAMVTVDVSLIQTVEVLAAGETTTFVMGCQSWQWQSTDGTMGCRNTSDAQSEYPPHNVTLTKPFRIGKYEVTQAQWIAVMGDNPSYHNCADFPGERCEDRPVQNVRYSEEVEVFVNRLNLLEASNHTGRFWRIPTEAEWEYAARGGRECLDTATGEAKSVIKDGAEICQVNYSGSNTVNDVSWNGNNASAAGGYGVAMVMPVGMLQPNALGLYDMSGNVVEWTSTPSYIYTSADLVDPNSNNISGDGSSFFFLRGGRYTATNVRSHRVSDRSIRAYPILSWAGADTDGIRLVLVAD